MPAHLFAQACSPRPVRLVLRFALMSLTLLCLLLPRAQAQTTGQVKYFPRVGLESRMVGGLFQGSPDNTTWTTLYTVAAAPADAYTTATFTTNPTTFRFLRYLAPSGSYGNVAEIEFDSVAGGTATKMTGTGFGTAGSYNNDGFVFGKALDGSTSTYFDAPAPGSGDFVGIDRGAPLLTSLSVSPSTAGLSLNKTQAFTASARDQYGTALTTQPSFTWSVVSGGVGTVSASGVYSSGATAGSASVKATSGNVSGAAAVTVTSAAPTVATAAAASPASVTGTTSALSVLGADDGGEAGLIYTWATTGTPPATVTFSANGTNAAKTTTATFTKAGSYSLQVTIKDAGGLTATSSVAVTVSQTLTSIVVSPNPTTLNTGGAQTFTASAKDQFGAALATQPAFTWSVVSGGVGSITSGGVYSAGTTAGTATVKAASGTVSGTAAVTVTASLPSVSDLSTYTTGSGRIALYWTPVPNAVGYNIYRGTSAGGEDYVHPVNGAAPVNAASYPGSPMDLYSDTGLTNGTGYFYTITAIYNSGHSQPSNEDSDMPDPAAVPWDTRNPSAIISAFNAAFASDTSNIGADPYTLRVVGPDNTIYDPSFSTAQPPDGTVTPGTNQLVRPDGSTQALPDDDGELDPPALSASGLSPNAVGTPLPGDKGPFRRVRTRGNANNSGDYRGASGIFYLPTATVTTKGLTTHSDSPVIYLGISGSSIEVDAGLAYQQKDGGMWALEMQIGGKIVSAQGNPAKTIMPATLINAPDPANTPNQYKRFAPNSSVTMTYWAWGRYSTGRAKLSLLLVDDFDTSEAAALGAPARYLLREENVRVKRVHAVAQATNQKGPVVFPTGTTVGAASWSQGTVILPDVAATRQGWSSADGTLPGEDGSYDGGNSDVNAYRTSPFIQEDSITIVIHPN